MAPGQWVMVLGAASSPGSTTMANSYGPVGPQTVNIAGVQVQIARCLTQASIAASPGPNPISAEDNFEIGRIDLCVTPGGNVPPALEGAVEPTPFANPLNADDANFFDGDFIRWNYNDFTGNNTGTFGATVLNVGFGAAPAVGVTTQIPGFNQLWALSTPTGLGTVYGPFIVGSPDQIVFVPPGLFGNGDVVRIQALILDTNSAGTLPVTPMFNTISYTYTPPPPVCTIEESFDTTATGLGNYPVGWSDGGGIQQWRPQTGGTSSTATGPTAAFNGANYMYTETSGPAQGDTFILNTDTYTDQTVSQMSFYLSRIGATMGTLEVFYNDGVNPPLSLGTWTGPNGSQTQGGDEWQLITLPFAPSASYSFQFVYARGSSFTGDCAIDRFCLGN